MHLRPIKNATLAHALFGRYGKKRQERRVYGNRGGSGRRGGQRRDPYHRRDNRGRDRGYGGDRRRDDYRDRDRDDRGGRRGRSRSRSRDQRGVGETITTMATMAEEKGVVEVVKERRAVLA